MNIELESAVIFCVGTAVTAAIPAVIVYCAKRNVARIRAEEDQKSSANSKTWGVKSGEPIPPDEKPAYPRCKLDGTNYTLEDEEMRERIRNSAERGRPQDIIDF